MLDIEKLKQIFLVLAVLLVFYFLLSRWLEKKTGEAIYDDYIKSKPPLYVYYMTSGIKVPMTIYFVISAWVSLLLGLWFANLMNNLLAGMILGVMLLFQFKQIVQTRSIKRSQIIDERLPEYFHAFHNIYQHNRDPLFALGYANKYAPDVFKSVFEKLHMKLLNNADPSIEIQKVKIQFKNPIIRDYLDAFESELYEGYGFDERLERLIERSESRKEMATERRIDTFGNILLIRSGTIMFFLIAAIFLYINPDYLIAFQNHIIGRIAVDFIVISTAFMTQISQSLILLSEG
ncbi:MULTISPECIES: hypothetical protein [Bacillota]|uniref:hypothetical protein n=1 Tax=Bacillota TaxID=1239 RepID=UPI0039F0209C